MKILAKQRLLLAYNKEEVDNILEKYVIDYNTSHLTDNEFLEDAKYYYSNKEPLRVFRGLLFQSEGSYKNFIKSIKSGYLTTTRATSWTTSKDVAEDFATHRKNLNNSVAMGLYLSMERARRAYDKIDGYKGVVLVTNIDPKQGIELEIGGEAEVLLPPGRYKVSRYEFQSYDEIVGDRTAEEVLKLAAKKDFIDLLRYFKSRGLKPEDLSEDIKRKIFLYTYQPSKRYEYGAYLETEPVYYKKNMQSENEYNNYLYRAYIIAFAEKVPNLEQLKWYDKSSQDIIIENFRNNLKSIFNKVKKLTKVDFEKAREKYKNKEYTNSYNYRRSLNYISNVYKTDDNPIYFAGVEWRFDIEYFVKKFGLESEYRSVLRAIEKAYEASPKKELFNRFSSGHQAARAYNMISNGNYMSKIMSISDPARRYQAIEQYNDDLARTVDGMSKFSKLNLL